MIERTADEQRFLQIIQETPREQLEKRLAALNLLESFKAAEGGEDN